MLADVVDALFSRVHDVSASEYRERFGIDKKQPLCSKDYSAMRRRIIVAKNKLFKQKVKSDKERIKSHA